MRKIWILFLIVFISCKKEDVYNALGNKQLSLNDKWVLIDGQQYVEYDGRNGYYNHFGYGKNKSWLTYGIKPSLDVENIERYKTTWEFRNDGSFILNGTTESTFSKFDERFQINIDGTSRPFIGNTVDYDNKIIKITVEEQEQIPYGVRSYSVLYFQKYTYLDTTESYKTVNDDKEVKVSKYMGVTDDKDYINPNPLDGTKWIISKVTKGFQSYETNDTIIFHKKYYDRVINGKILSSDTYGYSIVQTNDLGLPYSLTLYGYSPFGSYGWSALLTPNFINEYEIPLVRFDNISDKTLYVTASFKRIK